MVIVPRGNPVFENLNSYYLDLRRLLEHYQGEMGSGAIYLKSPTAEGAIFFEAHELLGGTYENRGEKLAGKAAIDRLLTPSPTENYQVSLYDVSNRKRPITGPVSLMQKESTRISARNSRTWRGSSRK